eukprot:COSAG04_NODE_394_length_15124_cov_10.557005_10_plen_89_part_00
MRAGSAPPGKGRGSGERWRTLFTTMIAICGHNARMYQRVNSAAFSAMGASMPINCSSGIVAYHHTIATGTQATVDMARHRCASTPTRG